jgi:hypothetical protein
MKIRKRKRRLYPLCQLTVEVKAWLDMVPVGREFGSKDYERLAKLDALTDAVKASADLATESIEKALQ